jgi:hypothetical protein
LAYLSVLPVKEAKKMMGWIKERGSASSFCPCRPATFDGFLPVTLFGPEVPFGPLATGRCRSAFCVVPVLLLSRETPFSVFSGDWLRGDGGSEDEAVVFVLD